MIEAKKINTFKMMTLLLILTIPIGMSIDIYIPSMPEMVDYFHTTRHAIQLTVPIYILFSALGQLIWGPMVDRFGRRRVIVGGCLIGILGTLFSLLAPNSDMLLLSRVITGFGFSSQTVGIRAILSDLYSGKELAKKAGIFAIIGSISPITAPVIGGYLGHAFGWKSGFIFIMITALLVSLVFLKFAEETLKEKNHYAIHPRHVLKNYFSLLKHPKFLAFVCGSSFMFSMALSFVAVSAFLFQKEYDFSQISFGWICLGIVFSCLPGRYISMKASHTLGINKSVLLSYSITLSSGILLLGSFICFGLPPAFLVILIIFISSLGQNIMYPNSFAGAMEDFRHMAGSASAFLGALQFLVGSLVSASIAVFPASSILLLALAYTLLSLLGGGWFWWVVHRRSDCCIGK